MFMKQSCTEFFSKSKLSRCSNSTVRDFNQLGPPHVVRSHHLSPAFAHTLSHLAPPCLRCLAAGLCRLMPALPGTHLPCNICCSHASCSSALLTPLRPAQHKGRWGCPQPPPWPHRPQVSPGSHACTPWCTSAWGLLS